MSIKDRKTAPFVKKIVPPLESPRVCFQGKRSVEGGLFENISSCDFSNFRASWETAGAAAVAEGPRALQASVDSLNRLSEQLLCTDSFLLGNWEENSRSFQLKLRGAVAILHFLRQDRRLSRKDVGNLEILGNIGTPYFLITLMNGAVRKTGGTPCSLPVLREAILEQTLCSDSIGMQSLRRNFLLVRFWTDKIGEASDTLGRRHLRPSSHLAQYLLAFSFAIDHFRFFALVSKLPMSFNAHLFDWPLLLGILLKGENHVTTRLSKSHVKGALPEFLSPLLEALVKQQVTDASLTTKRQNYSENFSELCGKYFGEFARMRTKGRDKKEVIVKEVKHGNSEGIRSIPAEEFLASLRLRN